jgi:hypothetical protein
MERLKKKIIKSLNEANFMVKPEDVDQVIDKLGKNDVVKLVDEAKDDENNPWAICTASVGREDKEKYESCVKQVKAKNGIQEEIGDHNYEEISNALIEFEGDWQMDLLPTINKRLKHFEIPDELRANIMSKISRAPFGGYDDYRRKYRGLQENGEDYERGSREVEYGISPEAGERDYEEMDKLKENVNPKMTKRDLVETILKNRGEVIKTVKVKKLKGDGQKKN